MLFQVNATFPRLILHVHDDDSGVRQACRVGYMPFFYYANYILEASYTVQCQQNTLRRIATFVGVDGLSSLFNTHCFNSDHRYISEAFYLYHLFSLSHDFNLGDHSCLFRSDYEDFIRNVTRLLCQNFSNRTDAYMALAIQVCTFSLFPRQNLK